MRIRLWRCRSLIPRLKADQIKFSLYIISISIWIDRLHCRLRTMLRMVACSTILGLLSAWRDQKCQNQFLSPIISCAFRCNDHHADQRQSNLRISAFISNCVIAQIIFGVIHSDGSCSVGKWINLIIIHSQDRLLANCIILFLPMPGSITLQLTVMLHWFQSRRTDHVSCHLIDIHTVATVSNFIFHVISMMDNWRFFSIWLFNFAITLKIEWPTATFRPTLWLQHEQYCK